jgi:formylglycine-generating enzyme required for sulfatase activity/dienelactone hydrolase/predicted Ser/Thr protein kinase
MGTSPSDRYEILEKLGEGGMGVLYRARDTRLGRTVALKLLRPETLGDPDRRARFVREARAASALNHPNIVTVYDIDQTADGSDCIAMEYVDGRALDRRLHDGPLPVEEALRYALEIAAALAAAHAAGIVHRDVKPANVMLTRSGQVKVLDFGLAKRGPGAPSSGELTADTLTRDAATRAGVVLGTPAYMSPEQARGDAVDARSDVFSCGALLYEMLAGQRPFQGASVADLLSSILRDDPPPLESRRAGIPHELAAVVSRCLARDPGARYASGAELLAALQACQPGADSGSRAGRSRRWLIAAALLALAVLAGLVARQASRIARERQARRESLPELERLVRSDRLWAAHALARRVAPLLGDDPAFDGLWREFSVFPDVASDPPGAEVAVQPYLEPQAEWQTLGRTPLTRVRLPFTYLRWRLQREGYEPFEGASLPRPAGVSFALAPKGSVPAGMVSVPGGAFRYRNTEPVTLEDFFLDRYEVTNAQFKSFVDAGGYREPRFWKAPFLRDGRALSFAEAMELLRDATGRPGPAGWELGSYPEGQQDYPVSGVSWYEASAYAEYAGKSLPGFYHWYRATELGIVSDILLLSNFGGQGPAPVGRHQGIGPYGTYDQAGNVREWVANESRDERRFTLGGAWNDPTYLYSGPEYARPWDRQPTIGFRCAKYQKPPDARTLGPVVYFTFTRDYAREKPVSDTVFAAYRSLYAYDRTPLEARVERTDDSPPQWRKETVSFAAAYGNERVVAHLFLPKGKPPYQVVVYFPPSSAQVLRSSDDMMEREFSFLVKSGRAVLFPVYKGTFERRIPEAQSGRNVERDTTIQWSKDFFRSLDYLATRSDVRADHVAFYGLSLGAYAGLMITALEPRVQAAVLVAGGLSTAQQPGEVDPLNFAPRIHVPVLLIAGREDFRNPLELSQKPLMRLLGSTEKRHVVFEGGHVPPRQQEVIKEALEWLDRYLGPV